MGHAGARVRPRHERGAAAPVARYRKLTPYLAQLEATCDSFWVEREPDLLVPIGDSEYRGRVQFRVTFPEFPAIRHFLAVREVVDMLADPYDPRVAYAYEVVIGGARQWAYHRHGFHRWAGDHRHDQRFPQDDDRHFEGSRTVELVEVFAEARRYMVRMATEREMVWKRWPQIAPRWR